MYFESIDDLINFELCSRRFNGNMTKFHYNGISMNNKSIEWFPNVETLHLYEKAGFVSTGIEIGSEAHKEIVYKCKV